MPKGNPNPSPSTRFGAGSQDAKHNNGGRTPTAWLREFLAAACDRSEGKESRRLLVARDTYWRARRRDPDTGLIDQSIPVKDANEAAKTLMAYDMGKPIESVEVTEKGGPRVHVLLPSKGGRMELPPELSEEEQPGEPPSPVATAESPTVEGEPDDRGA